MMERVNEEQISLRNCEQLQEIFTHILKDNIYMCVKSVMRSNTLVSDINSLSVQNVEQINTDMRKLFDRMSQNITDFVSRLDSVAKYNNQCISIKSEINNVISLAQNKNKSKLSLQKNNTESTEDTDINLTSSLAGKKCSKKVTEAFGIVDISTEENRTENGEESKQFIDESVVQKQNADKEQDNYETNRIVENSIDDSGSEDGEDSRGPIEMGYFDVPPVSRAFLKDIDEVIEESNIEFDKYFNVRDTEGNNKNNEKSVGDVNMVCFDLKGVKENQEQIRKNNNELLKLLIEATNHSHFELIPKTKRGIATEEQAQKALAELEEDMTDFLTDSDSVSSWSTIEGAFGTDDDDDDDDRDAILREPAQFNENISCSQISVQLVRLDSMDETEIDRLCNLSNINKRKCPYLKKISRRNKAKRLKMSSKLQFSESSDSSGDTTPSLSDLESNEPDLLPKTNFEENKELIAEMICREMDCETESSLESETDIEGNNENKQKTRKKTTRKLSTSKENFEDKNISKWRNDSLLRTKLWSDSDDSDDSEDTCALDPKRSKIVESKSQTSIARPAESYDCISISDSDNPIDTSSLDSDSDVELIDNLAYEKSVKDKRNLAAMLDEGLDEETQMAKDAEDQRIRRLEELSQKMELVQSQHNEFMLDIDVATGTPLITVNQNLSDKLKPHQRSGVQFMWEACYESVEMLNKNNGTGCILAHCMGLGKTLQVITLIHTLFAHPVTNTRHVLIICPLSTVLNWKNEFEIALGITRSANFSIQYILKKNLEEKCKIVKRWRKQTGVLVVGYECLATLTNDKLTSKIGGDLKKIVMEALVEPGPNLVVCDEGHLLKNEKTLRTQALMKIATKRRIVLTGTPLQNNLKEYYYMLEFVKPHLLGTLKEYKKRFLNPIMKGQYHDSGQYYVKLMKKRTHVLNKLLRKTVQRVESSVLKDYLPTIMDYTVFVRLHRVQIEIYKTYINMVKTLDEKKKSKFLQDFYVTQYICLHPYIFQLKSHRDKMKPKTSKVDLNDTVPDIPEDWWKPLCPEDVAENLDYGPKLKVALSIIEEAERLGDKLLIFSLSLVELDCMEHFLKSYGTKNCSRWILGVHYFRMDGAVSLAERDRLCNSFNDTKNTTVKAFLISHRVGGLGLNLTAANRIILLSTNFNPCHDTQSIFRAYRFGQTKKCFVYRLIAMGTMDEKVYRKCVVKLAVASTVVDKFHVDRHYKCDDLHAMYECNFDTDSRRPLPNVPSDKLLATLLQTTEEIYKYHEHQALLENRPEEELDDEEKKLAWDEFNIEASKIAPVPVHPLPLNRNPSNIIFIQPLRNHFPIPVTRRYCITTSNASVVMLPNPLNVTSEQIPKLNENANGEFNYALNKFQ